MNLKIPAWCSLGKTAALLTAFFLLAYAFFQSYESGLMHTGFIFAFSALFFLVAAFQVIVLFGYLEISSMLKEKLLKVGSLGIIIVFLLLSFVMILSDIFYHLAFASAVFIMLMLVCLMLLGILSILLGVGLLRLRGKAGSISTLLGALFIVSGIFVILLPLLYVSLLLLIPLFIIETVFFFRLAGQAGRSPVIRVVEAKPEQKKKAKPGRPRKKPAREAKKAKEKKAKPGRPKKKK
ncbi:MAG TPA: hypothetical protein ENN46_01145 [Candidatus Woesearchaeota archaeon]|nr:hypothetical protein [Candidatus Woesearchaeota archaeon]